MNMFDHPIDGIAVQSPTRHPLNVVTMAFDEVHFLRIWLRHWRRYLPDDALWVIVDGGNPDLLAVAEGVNVIAKSRPRLHDKMERDRWRMLSEFCSELLTCSDVVIYSDVDEILVVDPKSGKNLVSTILDASGPSNCGFGLEIIHRMDKEPANIDLDKPVLGQRQYFRNSLTFAKPGIIRSPIKWDMGGHFCSHPGPNPIPHLYNVHLRFFDIEHFFQVRKSRRENTTEAREHDGLPDHKWRQDDDEARKLIDQLQSMWRPPYRSLMTRRMRRKMQKGFNSSRAAHGPHKGFVITPKYNAKYLQKLPRRFLGLI